MVVESNARNLYEGAVSIQRSAPIKMGELVQSHADGWLVGMPFPLKTTVTATVTDEPGVSIEPASFSKTQRLCQALLEEHHISGVGIHLCVLLPVPPGMGCATSTVSMRLSAQATADAMGILLDPRWLGQAMARIEPCDASCSDGKLVLWEFKRGYPLSCEYLLPHGAFVAAYPRDRALDTDVVDQCRPTYSCDERARLSHIYESLPEALRSRSLKRLAQMATLSAETNNHYFPKPEIHVLRDLRRREVIDGFFVAHSGSVVGAFGQRGRLKQIFDEFTRSLGPGYDVFGFEQDEKTERLPFLSGCGKRLLHNST